MKQTSIEWLEMEIVKIEKDFAIPSKIYELCEQAKEMHEKEIEDAYHKGCADQLRVYPDAEYNPEQYYSETYNK